MPDGASPHLTAAGLDRLAAQVLGAGAALEAAGVGHGALRPGRVVLARARAHARTRARPNRGASASASSDRWWDRAVLVGFGADATSPDGASGEWEAMRWAYASPEVAAAEEASILRLGSSADGERRALAGGDAWSLGAMLFEAATHERDGPLPGRGLDPWGLVRAAAGDWGGGCRASEGVRRATRALLEPDPSRRAAAAEALELLTAPPQAPAAADRGGRRIVKTVETRTSGSGGVMTTRRTVIAEEMSTSSSDLSGGLVGPRRGDAGNAASLAAFAIAWNGFIGVWTLGALAGGGPLFAAFSLPFWAAGVKLGREAADEVKLALNDRREGGVDGEKRRLPYSRRRKGGRQRRRHPIDDNDDPDEWVPWSEER